MEINQILVCRENKANLIKKYIKDYQVVTLKANIVGSNKNREYEKHNKHCACHKQQ